MDQIVLKVVVRKRKFAYMELTAVCAQAGTARFFRLVGV